MGNNLPTSPKCPKDEQLKKIREVSRERGNLVTIYKKFSIKPTGFIKSGIILGE